MGRRHLDFIWRSLSVSLDSTAGCTATSVGPSLRPRGLRFKELAGRGGSLAVLDAFRNAAQSKNGAQRSGAGASVPPDAEDRRAWRSAYVRRIAVGDFLSALFAASVGFLIRFAPDG